VNKNAPKNKTKQKLEKFQKIETSSRLMKFTKNVPRKSMKH